jgi:hypothetical protein
MKAAATLAVLAAMIACGPVQAAVPDLSKIDVVALVPRSPDVKPLTMSVPAQVQLKIARDPSAGNFIAAAGATRR